MEKLKLFKLPTIELKHNYKYVITLDNNDYVFHFTNMLRNNRWYLSIIDNKDNTLISGIKLVMGINLLKQSRHIENMPQGVLWLANWEDQEEATFENFGKKVNLYYVGKS